jgi:alpha-N-arabinofuranosidase
MYGDWQLGHIPLEEPVKKHNRIVETMRKIDPDMQAIAVGATGPWSEQILTTCALKRNAVRIADAVRT